MPLTPKWQLVGRVRWKPIEDIKKEINELTENGFREIVLVGINLSAYGKGSDLNLADAIFAVSEKIYKAANPQGEAGPAPDGGNADPNVYDADFTDKT